MTKLNLSYIAGYFDGEGCIYADSHGIRVFITNTYLPMLEAINEYFGGIGKIVVKKRYERDVANKECYILTFWSGRAETVLKELEPYLVEKRPQAILALAIRMTMGRKGRSHPPSVIYDYRDWLGKQMMEMKR